MPVLPVLPSLVTAPAVAALAARLALLARNSQQLQRGLTATERAFRDYSIRLGELYRRLEAILQDKTGYSAPVLLDYMNNAITSAMDELRRWRAAENKRAQDLQKALDFTGQEDLTRSTELMAGLNVLPAAWKDWSQQAFRLPDLQVVENITDQFRQQAEFLQQSAYASAQLVDQQEQLREFGITNDPLSGIHDAVGAYMTEASDYSKRMEDQFTKAFQGAGVALAQFCLAGQMNFKQLSNSIIADLTRIAAQRATMGIVSGITDALSGLFGGGTSAPGALTGVAMFNTSGWAKGGVLFGGSLAKYTNRVITAPTFFNFDKKVLAFAKGGIMGEAGPEAIMPLRRGPGGRLGVDASGLGGQQVVNNIYIQTPPGVEARTEQKPNQQGGMDLTIMLEMVDKAMAGGIASGRSQTAHALKMQGMW